MRTLPILALALVTARPAAAAPDAVLGAAAGWFADTPALGVALDTTASATRTVQARVDGSLFSRLPLYSGTTPLAGYAELELTAAVRLSPNDRLGLSVAGELMATGARDQDCGMGDGCRWYSAAQLGPAVLVASWAPGLRWARRTSAGGGLDLGVAPQLVMQWDYGLPILRIDLDIIRPSGWVFGLETNRYGGLATVGHRI